MTAVKTTANLPLITMLNFLTRSPLTYVKSTRHIVLEITNYEEYRWLKIKSAIYTSTGQLETSLICIKMKFMYIALSQG
jgi:hypothetical protein